MSISEQLLASAVSHMNLYGQSYSDAVLNY